MRDLMNDGVAHDLGLPPRRGAHALDRPSEDADAIGEVGLLRAASRERYTFVQAKKLAILRLLFLGRLVFNDDLDIAHSVREFGR